MLFLVFVLLVFFVHPGAAATQSKYCYGDYPELSGLICYQECKSGFKGVGPVCYGNCPPNTVDIGLLCTKKTYTRTAGKPISYCPPDKEKNGALCYQKCKSGYYGVGPVCWQRCRSGYTDIGALCSKGWSVYAKSSYGRGVGHGLWCQPHEEQVVGLCYPKCRSGYYGVSFVCWASCTGSTTDDTGTQCQKKSYPRGVGKAINCVTPPNLGDIANWQGLVSILKKADGGFNALKAIGCSVMYLQLKPFYAIAKTLNGCLRRDDWTTVSISYGASAASIVTGSVEIGVAEDVQQKKALCWVGWCAGAKTDVSVGASFAIGYWRSIDDIKGVSTTLELGGDIPGTEAGADIVLVFSTASELIGLGFEFGIGVGLSPVDVGVNRCDAPEDQTISITVT